MPRSTVPRWSGKPRCGQRSSTAYAHSPSHNTQTGCVPNLVSRRPVLWRSSTVPASIRMGVFYDARRSLTRTFLLFLHRRVKYRAMVDVAPTPGLDTQGGSRRAILVDLKKQG